MRSGAGTTKLKRATTFLADGLDKTANTFLKSKSDRPLVSINIPTYNSEETLEECLQSTKKQTYSNIEIIIIDSFSQDRTLEIAQRYNAKTCFADTLSEARKLGVERSQGKYVLFLDSDQVLPKDAVEKCVAKCEEEEYDALTLFERSIIKSNTFIERVIAYDKWLFHSQRDDHPLYGTAIPRFFRSEVLRKIRWPEGLAVQEHNLIYYEVSKTGAKIGFQHIPVYHHEVASFAQFVRKFYRYGLSYIPALKQNKRIVFYHSMPRRVYFTRKAMKKPELFLGLFLIYLVKGVSTFIGVLAYCLAKSEERAQ